MLRIPKAVYETHYLQGNDGPIPVLKKIRKALKKGKPNRRVINVITIGGYVWSYHATRGWRRNKV